MGLYLFSPLTPVTDRIEVSHRAGWALYWAEELGAKLITTSHMDLFADMVKPGDTVYVYHGMEFKNALNFPGGPQPSLYGKIKTFQEVAEKVGVKLISMDGPMPNYAKMLGERLHSTHFNELKLYLALSQSSERRWPTTRPRRLVVGDSHALSLYTKGSRIFRNDGLTLHGALKIGLSNLIKEAWCPTIESIVFYFGNIDIRHHVLRHDQNSGRELLKEYRSQLKGLVNRKQRITVAEPLPIENESRKLPKTGWYKGEPFFGSWANRSNLRDWWAGELDKWPTDGISVYRHPLHFWNREGELDFDVMEKPQSVHIRPSEYAHINKQGESWTCVL
ncbi:hypothetical protein UFOVP1414_48 [uncultured Caudovirales phage]|uniref:Uncharacterized protein n=1 Tax=uncultured Caudovirales phage TaxID=2100421 RepID=A0A6J5SES7_9CAUD|nr:hypothetical protein UFOVP442_29 [uncultured Caudovirales phage]CAB4211915.1 hypothetical protein UFOVP1414_48 [uncultured Caudovirales phage]